MNVLNIGFYFT